MGRLWWWLMFRYNVWQVRRFKRRLFAARDENRRLRRRLGLE